jgi:NDP-sugar pyrophosphorylase family protein
MIKFFILAAGIGKRARPLSLIEPKPLFPLDGTPLIQLILDQLAGKGLVRGFVNLHYQANKISACLKNYRSISFFHESKLSGSGILSKAADFLSGDFLLVVNGDVFLDIPVRDLIDKINESNADGILLVKNDKTGKYSSLTYIHDRYTGFGPPVDDGLIYSGVALFRHSVAERIVEQSFFQTFQKHKLDIRILQYDGIWLDIGDPRSYFQSNVLYKKHINIDHESNSLSESVQISPDSIITRSIIWKNTTIQNNTRISNSIVTGDMVLNNVQLTNKIITEDAVYDL